MKIFTTVTSFGLIPKNALEKAIIRYCISENQKGLPIEYLEAYQNRIVEKIAELSNEHKRCKSINASWRYLNFDTDIHRKYCLDFTCNQIVHFNIYIVDYENTLI